MSSLITIIDTDNLQSKVYRTKLLPKKERRVKAVLLAKEFAQEVTPEFAGVLQLGQYADTTQMTIVAFERVR